METVLNAHRQSHGAQLAGKLEGEEGVNTQALSQWHFLHYKQGCCARSGFVDACTHLFLFYYAIHVANK